MAVGHIVSHNVGESRISGHLHVPCGLAVVNQVPTQGCGSVGHLAHAHVAHGIAVGRKRHFHIIDVAKTIVPIPFECQTVCRCGHIEQIGGALHPTCGVVVGRDGHKGIAGAVVIGSDVAQLEFVKISQVLCFHPETDLQFAEGIAELRKDGIGVSITKRQGLCAAVCLSCCIMWAGICRFFVPARRQGALR